MTAYKGREKPIKGRGRYIDIGITDVGICIRYMLQVSPIKRNRICSNVLAILSKMVQPCTGCYGSGKVINNVAC